MIVGLILWFGPGDVNGRSLAGLFSSSSIALGYLPRRRDRAATIIALQFVLSFPLFSRGERCHVRLARTVAAS